MGRNNFSEVAISGTMTITAMSNNSRPNGSTTSEDYAKTHTGGSTDSTDAATAATAVLKPSVPMPSTSTKIRGVDFNDYLSTPITVAQLTSHFSRTGFQASSLGRAIEIINNMVNIPVST
jgi:hypothetical protein